MKSKGKKKAALSLVMMSIVLSLAGCGGGGTNGAEAPAPEKTTAATQTEPAKTDEPKPEEPKVAGDLEIQYFVGGYGDGWWKEVIGEFKKKYPDVNIKESAGSQINEQMKPRWIQGNPPDVVYIDGAGSNETQMVLDDQLMDITDWVKDAKNVDGEPLTSNLIAPPQDYSGKNYTIPLVFGSWGTFYDETLFTEKGWDVPKDWDSFLATSEKIKADGVYPYIHTGKYPYYIVGGLLNTGFVSENGDNPQILKDQEAAKEGSFKNDAVANTLKKIVDMRDKGYFDNASFGMSHTDSQMLFLQHKDAMIPNGLWLENEMKKDVPEGFKFGFIPSVMQKPGGKFVAIPYTSNIAIAKKAKNPDAAKAFIEFIFTKQAAVRWAELTGALMNVKADLESSGASDVVKTAMKYFNGSDTIVAPVFKLAADIEQAENDATIALLQGSITPEEWMDRMEKAAAKIRK
ncbi:N-acetylglucosamine transport system substrate-binding protein [Paenibacillus sp. PastF-3]|jgi:N-acetylglucosamine transport system substrate-binding protein|uniref:extracellular solute-binding protein n=1 Tax=Paenibacillus TaxID=44249 RepID=UPI000BA19074|nr:MULTISPECIES: extracellular solute-binding protein [unclassified Paenibacillus]MDH6370474.1 N-acetylglucosamine transport system substrate-binding protein [Paenibacillus sp. PastF-3]OZQ88769.1 ABC transporter substrate-binding protein [Paenibacillus sp. VTT E-133291]